MKSFCSVLRKTSFTAKCNPFSSVETLQNLCSYAKDRHIPNTT